MAAEIEEGIGSMESGRAWLNSLSGRMCRSAKRIQEGLLRKRSTDLESGKLSSSG
jgi:hypothetical protein